jgi:hypothetical protein
MAPIVPRFVTPKERAENRARYLKFFYWSAVAIPLLVTVILFGYSQAAPLWLSRLTIGLDALFGFPVLWLLKAIAA